MNAVAACERKERSKTERADSRAKHPDGNKAERLEKHSAKRTTQTEPKPEGLKNLHQREPPYGRMPLFLNQKLEKRKSKKLRRVTEHKDSKNVGP